MIYIDAEGRKLAKYKVKYTRNNEEIEQFVASEGKEWWLAFAEKWDYVNIIEFTDVEYADEQLARFEKVKNMDIAENILDDYVIEGIVSEGLEIIALQNENKELKQTLADLTEVILMGGM